MNKKLLVSFALASLTGISTQAKRKNVFRKQPNNVPISSYLWWTTWVGKIHPYLSGHRKPTITKPMKPPIWNVWPKKGMMFTQAYACNISSATRCSLITGANNTRHRVTNWTLRKKQSYRQTKQYNTIARLELQRSQPSNRNVQYLCRHFFR